MYDIASYLKALKLKRSKDCLMHFALISLSKLLNQFKVKKKWPLNRLISRYVSKEERLKNKKHKVFS